MRVMESIARPVRRAEGCILKGFLPLAGGKGWGTPEMGAGPLVLQPVGKVGGPVVAGQVCAGCDPLQQVLQAA